jgi:hypothetical protein
MGRPQLSSAWRRPAFRRTSAARAARRRPQRYRELRLLPAIAVASNAVGRYGSGRRRARVLAAVPEREEALSGKRGPERPSLHLAIELLRSTWPQMAA